SPLTSVSYNESSDEYVALICGVEETYFNKSIQGYPMQIWYGEREPEWVDNFEIDENWVVVGNGNKLIHHQNLNISTGSNFSVIHEDLNLENYNEFRIDVLNISNATLQVSIINNSNLTNIFNITKSGIYKKVFNNLSVDMINLTLNTSSDLGWALIDKISIRDITLENTTEILNTKSCSGHDGTYENFENGTISNWNVENGNKSTNTNKSFVIFGEGSLKINFSLSSDEKVKIAKTYGQYYGRFGGAKRFGFWVYSSDNLNVSLNLSDDSGCSYVYNFGKWNEWKYLQPSLSNFSELCDESHVKKVEFIFENIQGGNISGIVYLDDLRILSSLTTGSNGISSVDWLPPDIGTFNMLCNITSNKTHYNASERLAFNEVKLVGEGVNEWEGFKE
ncbi:MAG: hypothetical protein KAU95_02180, partial [Candidatus Aenigmarchaeota archaeon]|nr:hypothetical protein [Candidatus Aenigmarchaeota archaeon]